MYGAGSLADHVAGEATTLLTAGEGPADHAAGEELGAYATNKGTTVHTASACF